MNTAQAMQLACVGFGAVAAFTWFFSSRPRLFVRAFVPRDELRGAVRGILRDPTFRRSTRTIALIQFGVAAVFGVICIWLWLA